MLSLHEPGDSWGAFSNFWTETVPESFQAAWKGTSEWADEYVKPFFESIATWFQENADWLWPVAIAFVAGAALITGIALSCLACKKEEPKDIDIDLDEMADWDIDSSDAGSKAGSDCGYGNIINRNDFITLKELQRALEIDRELCRRRKAEASRQERTAQFLREQYGGQGGALFCYVPTDSK